MAYKVTGTHADETVCC